MLSTCQAELQQVQAIYPLNSDTPITDQQVQQILTVAKQNNLPTDRCCTSAKSFDEAGCACDASLPPVLAQVGLQVSSTGLQSGEFLCDVCSREDHSRRFAYRPTHRPRRPTWYAASKFTGMACNFTPQPC